MRDAKCFEVDCRQAGRKGRIKNVAVQFLVKAKRMQTFEGAGCLVSSYGLRFYLDRLLWMNIKGSFRDLEQDSAAVETLRTYIKRDKVYKFDGF